MSHNAAQPDPWVAQHLGSLPAGGLVLDLACGAGRHSKALLDAGHSVLAADIDTQSISGMSHPELEVLQYDFESEPWPFPPEFFEGMVVCNYLHRPLLEPIAASLKPNGVLIYTTFMTGNEAFGRPRNPDFLLQPDELKTIGAGNTQEIAFVQGSAGKPTNAVKQSIVLKKLAAGY